MANFSHGLAALYKIQEYNMLIDAKSLRQMDISWNLHLCIECAQNGCGALPQQLLAWPLEDGSHPC
jgi:hypothetical protein